MFPQMVIHYFCSVLGFLFKLYFQPLWCVAAYYTDLAEINGMTQILKPLKHTHTHTHTEDFLYIFLHITYGMTNGYKNICMLKNITLCAYMHIKLLFTFLMF